MAGPDPLLARAIEAHRSGRLSEADAGYRRILRAHPDDADALHFLGLLRFQQKDPAAGIELVQKSLRVAPGNAHAWNNLGNMFISEGRPGLASEAYGKATELLPTLAEAWYNLGVSQRRSRDHEQALKSFTRAIEVDPRYTLAYESLGMLLYRLGRVAESAVHYRRWSDAEPGNPIARHMAAATSGESVPERAGDEYVARLFDGFASSFDESLAALGYRAPQLITAALGDFVDFQSGRLDVLDAGCGTGLCGPLLRSTARAITGVDLSEGMIEKARARQVYDELVVAELCAFMRTRPAAFDVVVSADTLCYFGALEEAFAAAHECMRRNAVLAFTLEAMQAHDAGQGYRIEPHGRYCHSADYVSRALRTGSFEIERLDGVVLRRERGRDVAGHLVIARRTA